MTQPRLASITIDLDSLSHYEALHGLPLKSKADAVATLAPPRLAELLDERNAKGTFFVIGSEISSGGEPLKALAAQGHELGNHTLHHLYTLTRGTSTELHEEVEGGAAAIVAVTGKRPVGFRAPGYTLTSELLAVVASTGHTYDSSAFPAAPYYGAKALVMGLRQLQGRTSVAILDRPGVLLAPREPYRPSIDDPYVRGDGPLLELPLAVDPLLRLPFYGTLVVTLPWPVVKAVYASARRLRFLNFHLHGVDLMDPSDGMDAAVTRTTPDLAIPAARKIRRLREVFGWLARDYQLVTLAAAAARLGI
jgi:peptidoglycan-N-acetylglucosamine deacetylase